MNNQIWRKALPFVLGAAGAALMPSAALAAMPPAAFSIDTTGARLNPAVPNAWIGPDYIIGGIQAPGVNEAVYIGGIVLNGYESGLGALPGLQSLPVFCIDIADNLQDGVFTAVSQDYITTGAQGAGAVTYSSTQLANVLKFMVYAEGAGHTQALVDGYGSAITSAAEQAGIWEIISEPNATWNFGSGSFAVNPWYGGEAIGLAGTWLANMSTVSTTNYSLALLAPGPGNQIQTFLRHSVPAPDAATTGAVPEPATWGLMIVGFGAVGATMRRRRATVARA